jgi:hypothetical protein
MSKNPRIKKQDDLKDVNLACAGFVLFSMQYWNSSKNTSPAGTWLGCSPAPHKPLVRALTR